MNILSRTWSRSQSDQPPLPLPLPLPLRTTLRQIGAQPSPRVLAISTATQSMILWERCRERSAVHSSLVPPRFLAAGRFRVSTSKFGTGQTIHSRQTPLGLHQIARKIGGGHPIGTVFKHRQVMGYLWRGCPEATICHRILWLEGLEPGRNRGGEVDTLQRYIYIHGFSDETTLGRPQSNGCIHLAGTDLLPLFDRLSIGTLVWISAR